MENIKEEASLFSQGQLGYGGKQGTVSPVKNFWGSARKKIVIRNFLQCQ